MGGRIWLAFALSLATGPAWGQSEEEVTAAAGKQIDLYAGCLRVQANDLAKSENSDDEEIVNHALKACADKRKDLVAQLQMPPLNMKASDAADAVQGLDDTLHSKMLETIKAARSS